MAREQTRRARRREDAATSRCQGVARRRVPAQAVDGPSAQAGGFNNVGVIGFPGQVPRLRAAVTPLAPPTPLSARGGGGGIIDSRCPHLPSHRQYYWPPALGG